MKFTDLIEIAIDRKTDDYSFGIEYLGYLDAFELKMYFTREDVMYQSFKRHAPMNEETFMLAANWIDDRANCYAQYKQNEINSAMLVIQQEMEGAK